MSPFTPLAPAVAVMFASFVLTYHPTLKAGAWYPLWVAGCGAASGLLWAWAVRLSRSPADVFAVSIAWDAAAVFVFAVLPAVAAVTLTRGQVVGVALVVAGFVLVRWG